MHGGEEEGSKVNSPWYNIVYIASDAYSVCFLIHCIACLWELLASYLASYPGRVGGEKRPGIDCLRMHNNSQKNLGIRLCLETVGKINTYMSDIFPYH